MGDLAMIEAKFQALSGRLDEATLRMWAATEARSLGRGGVSAVAKAIGMSRTTIHTGLAELKTAASVTLLVVVSWAGGHLSRKVTVMRQTNEEYLVSKETELNRILTALSEAIDQGTAIAYANVVNP
jgi:DNA-binding phage protein